MNQSYFCYEVTCWGKRAEPWILKGMHRGYAMDIAFLLDRLGTARCIISSMEAWPTLLGLHLRAPRVPCIPDVGSTGCNGSAASSWLRLHVFAVRLGPWSARRRGTAGELAVGCCCWWWWVPSGDCCSGGLTGRDGRGLNPLISVMDTSSIDGVVYW